RHTASAALFPCATVFRSTLRYVSLQNWSRNVAHVHKQRAHVGRDARLESLTVSLGGDAARVEIESTLAGPGAESEMLGLYFADEGQHFNQYTVQHHAEHHGFSDVLFKIGRASCRESAWNA